MTKKKKKLRNGRRNSGGRSRLESKLLAIASNAKLSRPISEYKFYSKRRWRFDFAWPEIKLAVEVQGGIYVNGRHARGAALEQEYEKLNAAQILGWTVLLFGPTHINKQAGRVAKILRYVYGHKRSLQEMGKLQ